MAAVIFLGEDFYLVNAGGLAILIMGVAYFNYHKYRKMAVGEIKPNPKLSSLDRHPSDGDLSRPGMLRVQVSCMGLCSLTWAPSDVRPFKATAAVAEVCLSLLAGTGSGTRR